VPKIISECCELMKLKLCHINCSGPVFLRHTAECHTIIMNSEHTHMMHLEEVCVCLCVSPHDNLKTIADICFLLW